MATAAADGRDGIQPMLDKDLLGDLRKLANLLHKSDLEEIEVEKDGTRLKVKRPSPIIAGGAITSVAIPAAASAGAAPETSASEKGASVDGFRVVSPFVGTFYRAASPTSDPFVKVGQEVKKGDPLCIVEAMKLMNEIEAPVSGRVAAILLENGDAVEYGQELFVIS